MRRALILTLALGLLSLAGSSSASAASTKLFHSPSGNIACAIGGNFGARCDIGRRDWTARPKPASCKLDWGNGLEVGPKGRGRYTCAGDTLLGSGTTLQYGHAVKRGRYRCVSYTVGVRCVNRRTGHGFKISRQRAKRF